MMMLTPTVAVVPMRPDHIGRVEAIDATAFSKPWSRATWERELESESRLHLVAQHDGIVIAHAGAMFIIDEAHLTTVATHSNFRRKGVALRLVGDLIRAIQAGGYTTLRLEVRAADRGSHRFYGRFGFVPAGIRRDYYAAPTDDALLMWLPDLDGVAVAERLDRLDNELREIRTTGQEDSP